MNDKLISVLVPMYNSEKYILDCIKSIQNQTYENIEIVVVDDGSKDNSYQLVNELMKDDNRIKLYQKENEKSVSITRNYLLSKIKGDYFIFVDSDDVVSPFYLELLMKSSLDTNADISCCGYTIRKKGYSKNKKLKGLYTLKRKDALAEMILGKDGHFMVWNKLIKTNVLKDTRFYKDLNYGEDFGFVFELMQNDLTVSMFKNKLYFYRLRKGSISGNGLNKSKRNFLSKLLEMEKDINSDFDKNILSCWIYVTSGLFLTLSRFKGAEKEYKIELKKIMAAHYYEFKNNKKKRPAYAFLLAIIKFFEGVRLKKYNRRES